MNSVLVNHFLEIIPLIQLFNLIRALLFNDFSLNLKRRRQIAAINSKFFRQ